MHSDEYCTGTKRCMLSFMVLGAIFFHSKVAILENVICT